MKYQTIEEWERAEAWKARKGFAIGTIIATLFWGMILVAICHAEVSDEIGVRCVIGEASNQGLGGMTAVADALQNRGTTKGVYGCKSPHVDKEPSWVWKMARKAWQGAKTANPTQGASFWENVKAFGKPYWADSLVKTVLIKDHQFYKEVK